MTCTRVFTRSIRCFAAASLGISVPCLAFASSLAPNGDVSLLMGHVGEPSQSAISTFKKAGMREVKPHTLTPSERSKVASALSSLPPLNRRILLTHLGSLAFVDGIPGEGSGLTSVSSKPGHFDITLRATVIDESLSDFQTIKDRRDFTNSPEVGSITVSGRGSNALHYVLLHESTHIVDEACKVTAKLHPSFDEGVWEDMHTLEAPLSQGILNNNYFRNGKLYPTASAPVIYDALSNSPFVSLYSTASAREDFAELVAWDAINHGGGSLTIRFTNKTGHIDRQWKPLSFTRVRARFKAVDSFLAQLSASGTCV
jgi:hypothetical protein